MTLRDFWERYGVTVAIVAAVGLLFVVLPGNAPDNADTTVAVGSSSGAGAVDLGTGGGDASTAVGEGPASTSGGPGGGGALSGTGSANSGALAGGSATAAVGTTAGTSSGGTAGPSSGPPQILLGQGPCRPDGRMEGFSRYMPPCLKFVGDNGGATSRGVTKDKVIVVRYYADRDPGTQAILQGAKLADDPAVVKRAYETLARYANLHFETYGREVTLVDVAAGGEVTNDEAMRADAVRIVNDYKPFAVISGDPAAAVPKVLASELAARNVVCICTTTLSSQYYKENKPYIFGSLPTSTEYAIHVAEYVGKRLAGRNAVHAGDEYFAPQAFKSKPRKFGLIYLEGQNGKVDPEGKRFRDAFVAELAKYGVKLDAEAAYLYDPGRNQADMTNMIAQMKSAGVTSVIPIVDPLSPVTITTEATNQRYFPEWIQTGTGLSDTTTAGRIYDQKQWRHSFGISPLWVTWADVTKSGGYMEYHHMRPEAPKGDEGVLVNIYTAPINQFWQGIQMAGPNLTPDTFTQGMYNYPKTGGTPAAPLVYLTPEYPTQIKDFVEIFYAAERQGPDERGDNGFGMVMKVDQGKRYQAGEWPASDPKVFVMDNAVDVSDDPVGGGPWPHDKDGHRHPAEQRCLSCA